ncbi:hypothetical protein GY45DRAFT_1321625 [Cubamyces sp. BRFM 1775]|nr:hypothetical protein GY45DRAFT_1321625 [Cubamyces sp. BRFM 1775]
MATVLSSGHALRILATAFHHSAPQRLSMNFSELSLMQACLSSVILAPDTMSICRKCQYECHNTQGGCYRLHGYVEHKFRPEYG